MSSLTINGGLAYYEIRSREIAYGYVKDRYLQFDKARSPPELAVI